MDDGTLKYAVNSGNATCSRSVPFDSKKNAKVKYASFSDFLRAYQLCQYFEQMNNCQIHLFLFRSKKLQPLFSFSRTAEKSFDYRKNELAGYKGIRNTIKFVFNYNLIYSAGRRVCFLLGKLGIVQNAGWKRKYFTLYDVAAYIRLYCIAMYIH